MNKFLLPDEEILNTYELNFQKLLQKQDVSEDIYNAISAVLIQELQKIKTYDKFKQLIFGAIGYTRKKTINTDNVLNELLVKNLRVVKKNIKEIYLKINNPNNELQNT